MKKRSLYFLMILVLVAIIGGVYATWIYGVKTPSIENSDTALNIEAVEEVAGTYAVTNSIKIGVDQKDDTYAAKFVDNGGELVINYTPASTEIAPETIITITIENIGESGIGTIANNTINVNWDKNKATITATEVMKVLTINKVLATKADYDAYIPVLAAVKIKLVISAKAAA